MKTIFFLQMINHFHVLSFFLLFNLTCTELWSEPDDEDADSELMYFYLIPFPLRRPSTIFVMCNIHFLLENNY